jgi:hypothetical protein
LRLDKGFDLFVSRLLGQDSQGHGSHLSSFSTPFILQVV